MKMKNEDEERGSQALELSELVEKVQNKNDPMLRVVSIDWGKIKPGRVGGDLRQGRLLAEQIFQGIDWSKQSGSPAAMLSKILKKLPEDEKYEQIIQGFTDELTMSLLRSAMSGAMG